MIPVLYYHSIAPRKNKNWFKGYLTLELKYFDAHLKYFKSRGYKSVNLNELYDIIQTHNDNYKKEKIFSLTFDDGYADNYIYVYPLLKKYGFKGTIFINPESVDLRNPKRLTMEDYWNGKSGLSEIEKWGFLNWEEMREMEKSGIIDIQSHTLTHRKLTVSGKITGFHHPGADCFHTIGSLFPEKIPYYIGDSGFEKMIPYGYPFFEVKSSVIAKKASINPDFINSVVETLKGRVTGPESYKYQNLYKLIEPVYKDFWKSDKIVINKETEQEYNDRVLYELKKSKEIIEQNLNKKVDFCSWPHGENSEYVHLTALKTGYLMTSKGKAGFKDDKKRFERISIGSSGNNVFLTKIKTNYKIQSYRKKNPDYIISKFYNKLRYGIDI